MTITNYYRHKISVISFILIILVVLIHSHFEEAVNFPSASIIQAIFGTAGFATMAVPMFYLISGFLFFNCISNFSDCFHKQKKRVRTILIPFLLWNIIFILWYVVLENISFLSGFINSNITESINLSKPLDTLNFLFCQPAAFHLWFLRDLLFFIVITPIIYFFAKRIPWVTLAILIGIIPFIPFKGFVFFVLGAIISLNYSLDGIRKLLNKRICLSCLFIYLSVALIQGGVVTIGNKIVEVYLYIIISISGMIVIWRGYDFIMRKGNFSILSADIIFYTFFIYLFHEPTFNIIKKLSLKVFGVSSLSLIFLYFINIIIIVLISYLIGKGLKQYWPKVYGVLTGGR